MNAGHVECSSDVFKAIFGNAKALTKSRGKFKHFSATYTGLSGMRELELIFGKDFWKFSFDNGDYNMVYFYDDESEEEKSVTITHATKSLVNHFPKGVFLQDRLYFKFQRDRDSRDLEDQAKAALFAIPC